MGRAGIRAHDIGLYRETELPKKLAVASVPYVQLTLTDAFGENAPTPQGLNTGYAARVRESFLQNRVGIAVLSCYINPVHPNQRVRRAEIDKFCSYVRYARDFGCSLVATETGSLLEDLSYTPENHGEAAMGTLLESLREMVTAGEHCGVTVAMEGVHKFVAHSPESIAYILDRIDSPHLQVLLDPVNLLGNGNVATAMALAEESFDRYGTRIAAIHAKDYTCTTDGAVCLVPIGQGRMDWAALAALCAKNKPWLPVIVEETSPATMAGELTMLEEAFAACGEV